MADTAKLIIAALVLASGIGAYYVLGDYSTLVRTLMVLGALIASAVVAMQAEQGRAAWAFIKDSRTEVRKVVWPTRRETVQTTLMVMATVIIVALLLWGLDSILGSIVNWLISLGS
jgi:preprotein translocase subunit SecE